MTPSSKSGFLPSFWSKKFTREFESMLNMGTFFSDFSGEAKGNQKVKINTISDLVAIAKTTNAQVVLQDPAETQVELSLTDHIHAAFVVEDILKAQTSTNFQSEYARKGAYALRKAYETAIANLATGFSTNKGTYNTAITDTVILDSVETLDIADVPDMDRAFFLRPEALRDIRDIADYTRFDGTGFAGMHASGSVGENVGSATNGLKGMLYRAPIYVSTIIAKSGNNISNIYAHKEAFATARWQDVRVQSEYKIEYLGWLTVIDMMFGVVERRDNAGLELRS